MTPLPAGAERPGVGGELYPKNTVIPAQAKIQRKDVQQKLKPPDGGFNCNLAVASAKADGTPYRIRTCDLQIRNLMLYPAELRAHMRVYFILFFIKFKSQKNSLHKILLFATLQPEPFTKHGLGLSKAQYNRCICIVISFVGAFCTVSLTYDWSGGC